MQPEAAARLKTLTKAAFEPHVGETFTIRFDDARVVEARLIEVAGRGATPAHATREPFSIVFRCPAGAPIRQKVYTVSHERMGALDLFLVPIGQDEGGIRYEAVFT